MKTSSLLLGSIALLLVQGFAVAQQPTSAAVSAVDSVLAEVDGTKLTLSDLERRHPRILFGARNAYYDAHRKAAQQLIDDYLLEREAKKAGITVEQLLERHYETAVPKDPNDEVLKVYYEGVETTEPFENVRGQIIQALRERRRSRARKAYVQSLRDQAKIAMRIGPPRADIDLKGVPVKGNAAAPLTLVEYADYECPYCQEVKPVLDQLLAEYKGKVAYAFKDVPLPMHPLAQKAAEASHCAGAQGKYWEYHELLFETKKFAVPQLKEHARTLKLEGDKFDKCLDGGQYAAQVSSHVAEGQALGIQGTPSFFLNGRYIGGNQTYNTLRLFVEEELAIAGQQVAAGSQR